MSRNFDSIILTCEHAGNEVPKAYAALFDGAQDVLANHRGWDIGAFAVATGLATSLRAPLHVSKTTRLLIDMNRSLHVKSVWSEWSKELGAGEKDVIIERYYLPYRRSVEDHLMQLVATNKRVLHLSLHSFTPVFNGQTRNADVGILYDPKRSFEANLAHSLYAAVRAADGSLRVRRNYPYLGYTDGFTTHLRRKLPETGYAGIEIETKQDKITTPADQRRFIEIFTRAIKAL